VIVGITGSALRETNDTPRKRIKAKGDFITVYSCYIRRLSGMHKITLREIFILGGAGELEGLWILKDQESSS
jgi:hypothetical protein